MDETSGFPFLGPTSNFWMKSPKKVKLGDFSLHYLSDFLFLSISLVETLILNSEGSPAIETEDDECKIITEQTVFEHIRKKSKSFNVIITSNSSVTPLSETLILPRKRTRERKLVLLATEVLRQTEKSKISRVAMAMASPFLQSREVEVNGPAMNQNPTSKCQSASGSSVVKNFIDDDRGAFF